MPTAQIAGSHFETDGQGDALKLCINHYIEPNPQDPMRQVRLVTTPGSLTLDGFTTATALRGLAQADGHAGGKLLINDGAAVRTYDPVNQTIGALNGQVSGTDRTQWAIAETEAMCLAGGNAFVSDGGAIAPVTDTSFAALLADHGQTGFSSVATIGQRFLLSYGSRFAFTDALNADAISSTAWYTAEGRPDRIVAVKVLGSTVYVFGTQTIEPWYQTGNDDDPLAPVTGGAINRGAAARDAIVHLDNTFLFVGDDRNIYRLGDGGVINLSARDAWVTRHLMSVAAEDIVCSAIETEAHSFFVIRTPTRCIVYDVSTQAFHLRKSHLQDSWNYLFHQRIDADHFAASGETLATLSRDFKTDLGEPIVREFTAHLSVMSGQTAIESVRMDGTKGVGLTLGQGDDPIMQMAVSHNGRQFSAFRSRKLGRIGKYDTRTIWRGCGRAHPEQTIFWFRCADPVKYAVTTIAVNEDR